MKFVYVKDLSSLSDAELLTAYLNNDESEAPNFDNIDDKCYVAELFRRVLKVENQEISPFSMNAEERDYHQIPGNGYFPESCNS